MARLFISYNRKDAPYAWAVREWLMDEQGWVSEDIFFDAEHLHAGVDWEKKLLREAEAAAVMLFLASEHSLNIDSFCYRELKHATGQILAVTVGGVAYNDDKLDRALPESAKARQVTALDKPPTQSFSYVSPVDGVTTGVVELDPDCVAGIGTTLRELGVAPNSYTWTPKSDDDSPYPGLRPLMEGDEALFCGRDLEIRDGIKAIEDLRASVTKKALVIQAPSGAGKSSFLRAGLWHRLRCNPGFTPLAIVRTPNSVLRNTNWGLAEGLFLTLHRSRQIGGKDLGLTRQEIETQAESGLSGLFATFADADAGESGRRTLLIGIDQAEEMTALSPEDDAELDRLLHSLLTLPGDLDLRLILTARDDSVDATLARLAKAGLEQDRVTTWRLNRIPTSRLDDIINGPAEAARRANWPIIFDSGLVDSLVEAAGSGDESADALPILAITLQRIVSRERTPDGRITLEPERATAFVRGVVENAVEEALQAANADKEDLRKLVIPRLATWDPVAGSDGAVKRLVTGEKILFSGHRANLRPLAEALVNQRLLTRSKTDEGAAFEVTHEALLRVPPLENMIRDCREKFEQVRILEVETRDWVGSGKSSQNLVRLGGRLQEAMALLDDPDFGAEIRQNRMEGVSLENYLEACREHEQGEGRDRARAIMSQEAAASWLAAAQMAVGSRTSENLVHGFFDELTRIEFFETERGVWARQLLDHCSFPDTARRQLVRALVGDEPLPEERLLGLLHSLRGETDPGLVSVAERMAALGGELGRKACEVQVMASPGQSGDLWVEPRTGMVFTFVQPGTFRQGEGDEVRDVELTQGFWLGLYPCIQREWVALMGENPSKFKDLEWLPVEKVSWNDISEKFLPRMNEGAPDGWQFCLPSEAQWEYACRAGTDTKFSFGDDDERLADFGWYVGNSQSRTHPVGWKRPNPWGLYDMHGNVREWCQDCYGDLGKDPVTDPTGPATGADRVGRGGGWYDSALGSRSAYRGRSAPGDSYDNLGFRLVLSSRPPGQPGQGDGGPEASEAAPAKPGE